MSYTNPRQSGRLVLIRRFVNAFAEIHVNERPRGAIEKPVYLSETPRSVYQVNELCADEGLGDLYNFPYLFHRRGEPWFEANSYLMDVVRNKALIDRPTDDIRRRASKLLDYLIFCEDEGIDWLDFTGRRPALRPTYRYFSNLVNSGKRSAAVINQYTGVVFDFYKFVAGNWHGIDMDRVDSTKEIQVLLEGSFGSKLVKVEKRSQTKSVAPSSLVPIGFVRDDGEDLRPLANVELAEFIEILKGRDWSATERLILLTALMTGARKQTVLTMRMKHLNSFSEDKLQGDGTYLLQAGPGTGIDTKKNRSQRLYIPKQIADELIVLANSSMMRRRREKFRENMAREYPDLAPLVEDDMYIFLSDQGGCYYMAKNDPRYLVVKSKPAGQVTETVKRKLLSKLSNNFPKDFSYHWLRATYAFQIYQRLLPLLESGHLRSGEEISFIQNRLHHKRRETTENYLKLFKMHSDRLAAQELYEDKLFCFGSYEDLILVARDE